MTDSVEELAALRTLLAEALSPAEDNAVSPGAKKLRWEFYTAWERRRNLSLRWFEPVPNKQQEDT